MIFKRIRRIEDKNQAIFAKIYIFVCMFTFVGSQTVMKYLDAFSIYQLGVSRAVIMLSINHAYQVISGSNWKHQYEIYNPQALPIILTSLLFCISIYILFLAFRYLPITEVFIVYNMHTLWAQFFSSIILKERLSKMRIMMVFTSLLGLVLVIQPSFIFKEKAMQKQRENQENPQSQRLLGISLTFLSSCLYGFITTIIKLYGTRQSPMIATQYLQFFLLVIGSCFMIYFQDSKGEIYETGNLMIVFLFAITTLISQITLFKSYSMQSAATLAPYTFSSIIFSMIFDIWLFDFAPDYLTLAGASIIIISVIISMSIKENIDEK